MFEKNIKGNKETRLDFSSCPRRFKTRGNKNAPIIYMKKNKEVNNLETIKTDCGLNATVVSSVRTTTPKAMKDTNLVWQILSTLRADNHWSHSTIDDYPQCWGKECLEQRLEFQRNGSDQTLSIVIHLLNDRILTEYDIKNIEHEGDDYPGGQSICDIAQFVLAGTPMEVEAIECIFEDGTMIYPITEEQDLQGIIESIENHCHLNE